MNMRTVKEFKSSWKQNNGVSQVKPGISTMAPHAADIYAKFLLSLAFEE